MKITISVIKADVGGIGGHTRPSDGLLDAVRSVVKNAENLLLDHYIGYCGDDVHIVMTHTHGVENKKIHQIAWDAFLAGTEIAKQEGLYGAGQDLLKDSFSGNIKGMGPGVAEIECDERPNDAGSGWARFSIARCRRARPLRHRGAWSARTARRRSSVGRMPAGSARRGRVPGLYVSPFSILSSSSSASCR